MSTVVEILTRLRAGQKWLVDIERELYQMPDAGVGSDLERKFVRGLHEWADLDDELRSVHHYPGCVWKLGRCLGGAPVKCVKCAEVVPAQIGLGSA